MTEQRTQQQTLDIILKQHKELLSAVETPEGVSTEQISMFLNELAFAGAVVEGTEDRSLLSELLRYWSSIINDKTGNFPVVQLLPSGSRTQSSNRSSGWKVATLIQFIITVILATTTILALIHTTNSTPQHVGTPTAQPSATSSLLPRLESQYHEMFVNVDVNAFLSDNSNATNAFYQKIMSQNFLQNRRAGLVIVYGGAPDDTKIAIAQTIANKTYAGLHQLGKEGPTFAEAAYYNPLYVLGVPSSLVTIDIYLFTNP